MSVACDLVVIGGGPAGVEAALAAAAHGLTVTLVDEAPQAGGQVYRAAPPGFAAATGSVARAGDQLRAALRASPVVAVFDHVVWSVSPGFRVDALGPAGPCSWQCRALVVATGAQERVVPFPGWTCPGVLGLAGATVLLKAQRILPGRRTLVAGCGPLLFGVAAALLDAGGTVAAVVDLDGPADWLATLPSAASRPELLAQGAAWRFRLWKLGVPVLSRRTVLRAERAPQGLRVTIGAVDRNRRRQPEGAQQLFDVDSLAVGHGLTPSTDVTRLLRADHAFDAAAGGWHPCLDEAGRTSLAGLYVAGDGGGIAGVAAARIGGRLAGLAAACDLDAVSTDVHETLQASLRRDADRAWRFGRGMARTMRLRAGQIDAIPGGAVVCRCEDVTRAEIDAAAAEGATTLDQLKAWTRCGMGPCQGRICGDVAGGLMAARGASRMSVGQFTGRTPFRPLPLAELTGAYDYADIVLPPSAPL